MKDWLLKEMSLSAFISRLLRGDFLFIFRRLFVSEKFKTFGANTDVNSFGFIGVT